MREDSVTKVKTIAKKPFGMHNKGRNSKANETYDPKGNNLDAGKYID